ncbi:MAG TPA: class I SAM-dependent methyltransferase [Phycisphaerales bacterium]|nr:class I SAM-dependent methyltransferase [Phycisphaerales bacterium]
MDKTLTVPCPLLHEVMETRQSHHPHGKRVALTRGIKPWLANALHETVVKVRPRLVLEIGMCHGISSLAILSGLEKAWGAESPEGRLISIDPRQTEEYGRVGVEHVKLAGYEGRHTLLEEPDWRALPRLVEQGARPDLIYIDGNHAVDYVMLDAFYAHRLLPVGGVMGLNDCAMRSVTLTARWLVSHRDYQEIDVGLSKDYGHDPLTWVSHRVQGRNSADRYFRKLSETEHGYDGHLRW